MNTIKATIQRWWQAGPSTHSAAIAYYAIFSLAPTIIIFIVVLGQIFGAQAVQGKLVGVLQSFVGANASSFLQALISYSYTPTSSTIALVISIVVIVLGSLALFDQVERSLEIVWKDEKGRTKPRGFLAANLLAVIMIVLLGVVLIFSFGASALTTILAHHLNPVILKVSYVLTLWNILISAVYVIFLFTLLYKYVPPRPVSWKAALIGGVLGTVLFLTGRYILGLYITAHSSVSIYGAAGAVILVLVWFYYSAQIFFFGAAVTYVVDSKPKVRQTF